MNGLNAAIEEANERSAAADVGETIEWIVSDVASALMERDDEVPAGGRGSRRAR